MALSMERTLLDLLETGIVVVDRDGAVRDANPAAYRLLSVTAEELTAGKAGDWSVAASNANNEGVTAAPGAPHRRLRVRRRWIDMQSGGASVLLLDAVEPTAGEAAARLASVEVKLRELRTLSHNINNPLTALLGRSQILKAGAHGDPRVEKASAVIEESASRIAELARELSRTLRVTCELASGVDETISARSN
jgi:nitrogen-specific signal transduction histidine kinase